MSYKLIQMSFCCRG